MAISQDGIFLSGEMEPVYTMEFINMKFKAQKLFIFSYSLNYLHHSVDGQNNGERLKSLTKIIQHICNLVVNGFIKRQICHGQ